MRRILIFLFSFFLLFVWRPSQVEAVVKIYVNQVGYLPYAAKHCVVGGSTASQFQIIDEATGQAVPNTFALVQKSGDFGNYRVGDFSSVTTPGRYRIKVGGVTSYSFDIGQNVYDNLLKKTVYFCREQRCGDTTSWHNACHLDDALRKDNRQHVDATGGWHEAHNVQKQGGGMSSEQLLGLAHIKEVLNPSWRSEIINEINWGNEFFHKIIAPGGYKYEYNDPEPIIMGNNWTDNTVGTSDDRILGTDPPHNNQTLPGFDYYPWSYSGQFLFVASQALCSRLGARNAGQCLTIAKNAYNYSQTRFPHNSFTLGTYIFASIELYLASNNSTYKTQAIQKADELMALQEKNWHGGQDNGIRGFFYLDSAKDEVPEYITFWIEGYPLIALTRLIEVFPGHNKKGLWQEALRKHTEDYLLRTSSWNAFGQIAKEIYTQPDAANRRIGDLWYRYFFRHAYEDFDNRHRQGANAAVSLYAVGLTKAARILNKPELKVLAQRQLDWLLGLNPVGNKGVCSVTGFGYENFGPHRGASRLGYPQIDGGVANGISGTIDSDMPEIEPTTGDNINNVSSNEYWVANEGTFQWALAEIIADSFTTPPTPTSTPTPTLAPAIKEIIQAYGRSSPDINGDGLVNGLDFGKRLSLP